MRDRLPAVVPPFLEHAGLAGPVAGLDQQVPPVGGGSEFGQLEPVQAPGADRVDQIGKLLALDPDQDGAGWPAGLPPRVTGFEPGNRYRNVERLQVDRKRVVEG